MELKEMEAIKEGSFKKITVQYFHQEKESQINCIVLGLTDDQRLAVYTEEGAINNLYPKIIKKITITKSLTPEARTIMKDFYIQHKKFCKEMKVYDEKRQAYNQLYHLNETKLPEAMGYLTEVEFINIVMKNLPPIVKSDRQLLLIASGVVDIDEDYITSFVPEKDFEHTMLKLLEIICKAEEEVSE